MGPIIVGDIMLLIFSIYIGVFFRFFHSKYPGMEVGFHVWEACYSKKTWPYANRLAGCLSIGLGIIFYGILIPILIYLDLSRKRLSIILIASLVLYFVLLFAISKIVLRKKFNLKDNDWNYLVLIYNNTSKRE